MRLQGGSRMCRAHRACVVAPSPPGDGAIGGPEYAVTRVVSGQSKGSHDAPAGARIEVKRNGDCRDPSLHATGPAAPAPAAPGRALARTRVAGAHPGAARYVHRLSVRARRPAPGDHYLIRVPRERLRLP